jgi:hypothetical protein
VDVTATAPATNDVLQWNGTAWVAAAVAAGGPVAASAVTSVPAGTLAATNVQAALNELDTEKAPLASPAFTGTPTATTAAANDNSTRIATTAFVQAELGGLTAADIANVAAGGIAAVNVQAALNELDTEKVSKAGDTMTGPLVLPADPTLALQAATKQYVDAKVTGPASATDNAITRYDTTTGKLVQNSLTHLSDTGQLRLGSNTAPVATVDVAGNFAMDTVTVTGGVVNCALSNQFSMTIAANTTVSFSGVPSGRAYGCTISVSHTAGTVAWPASVRWASGGTAPNLTAGRTSLFMLRTQNGGTTWLATSLVDY